MGKIMILLQSSNQPEFSQLSHFNGLLNSALKGLDKCITKLACINLNCLIWERDSGGKYLQENGDHCQKSKIEVPQNQKKHTQWMLMPLQWLWKNEADSGWQNWKRNYAVFLQAAKNPQENHFNLAEISPLFAQRDFDSLFVREKKRRKQRRVQEKTAHILQNKYMSYLWFNFKWTQETWSEIIHYKNQLCCDLNIRISPQQARLEPWDRLTAWINLKIRLILVSLKWK